MTSLATFEASLFAVCATSEAAPAAVSLTFAASLLAVSTVEVGLVTIVAVSGVLTRHVRLLETRLARTAPRFVGWARHDFSNRIDCG